MSVTAFVFLLSCSIAITIPLANSLKKILRATGTPCYPNIVALDSAMVASTGMSVVHRWSNISNFESIHVLRLILLILCTWFLSMSIYDRLKQTKEQQKKYRLEKEAMEKKK